MKRLDVSSSGLEEQFSKMKHEYDSTSKELAERESELKTLKEAMLDRDGDAGELSSTESARSEIERKEHELRRLRSSLEDIRNVHCLNEGRIKKLQNKIEGVTHIISNRDSITEESVDEAEQNETSHSEQRLVVREIEHKTSKAQICNAEELKKSLKITEKAPMVNGESEITKKLETKEKENSFLQSVVKELKMELVAVQQSFSQEQASRVELNSMMTEKPNRNSGRLLPEKTHENEQLRRRNREYQQIRRNYRDDAVDKQAITDDNAFALAYHSPKHFGYPPSHHDRFAPDCEICAIESMSGASTYICSDEECDCDFASCEMSSDTSFPSDDEYDRSRMVSPGYRGVYSREAKNVSLQEATYAIKSQHRRNLSHRSTSPSPIHNPARSPKIQNKRRSAGYESPGSKYAPPQITRSNSARSAARPRSSTTSSDTSERRSSLERRGFPDMRPLSSSNHYYKREVLHPEIPGSPHSPLSRSLHSSDECSSISSGSGICSSGCGNDGQHECKKRKPRVMRGKLV